MPGLPSKSKSAAPLPTLPPKVEPTKKTSVDSIDKGGDGKISLPLSLSLSLSLSSPLFFHCLDLDAVPRSDILDNRKMKDRPKMNPRRPPSRGSLVSPPPP